MIMFTYVLDAYIQIAITFVKIIVVPEEVTYTVRGFKRRISSQLVQPFICLNNRWYTMIYVSSAEIRMVNITESGMSEL